MVSNVKVPVGVRPVKAAPAPQRRAGRRRNALRESRQLHFLLVPAVIYTIIFCYIPMIGIVIAFQRFSPGLGFFESPWVGFDNFERFFNSYYFFRLLGNTLLLGVYTLALFWIPIVFALLLNELRYLRFKKWAQVISYAPHFISMVVVVGMIYEFLRPGGIVNAALSNVGVEPILFMESPGWFPHIYVWSGVWQNLGWATIIYLAALAGVDPQLHDAARVDGASRLQRIRHVNLPALLPTIVVLFVLDVGRITAVGFEKVLLMQNDLNLQTSDVLQTFVYRVGIVDGEYSYGSAVSLFESVINLTLLIVVNKVSRRATGAGLW